MQKSRPPSRRVALTCLGLLTSFSLLAAAAACDIPPRISSTAGAVQSTVSASPTLPPTKFAIAVSTPTPLPTRTAAATSTERPTPTRTQTRIPSRTATTRPSPLPTSTAPPTPTDVSVGEDYGTLAVSPSPSDHSSALVEVNLDARGFGPTNAIPGLVNLDGPADAGAPQLASLFFDERVPLFDRVYQINTWDWSCNCAGALAPEPQVALAGLTVTPGEIIRVPRSSYYLANDYQALVLYADQSRITFNYTLSDNPVRGYTVYISSLAVDSKLVALYRQTNTAGRAALPALRAGQGIGRAHGDELLVAIRDAGAFMDPRSRKDWWRGK